MYRAASIRLAKIEEGDVGRIANRGVVPGEGEGARLAVDLEDGEVVATLVAAVEESAGGVDAETARVVATRPFLAQVRQLAVGANGEDADAVVQPVACIDESAIAGNKDF